MTRRRSRRVRRRRLAAALVVACWLAISAATGQPALAAVLTGTAGLVTGAGIYGHRHRRRFRRRVARRPQRALPGQGPRSFPAAMKMYIFRRDGYRCVNCGSSQDLQADHIVPYSRGGKTEPSNGRTLCGTCNRLKSDTFTE